MKTIISTTEPTESVLLVYNFAEEARKAAFQRLAITLGSVQPEPPMDTTGGESTSAP